MARKTFWMTWADFLLIAGIVLFSFAWWLHELKPVEEPSSVRIVDFKQTLQEIPVKKDGTIAVPGPLGTSVVEIRFGKVRMVSSPCRDKLCIRMGSVSRPGESILCIPNMVSVAISAKGTGADALTY